MPHSKEELVLVPPLRRNGGQLACDSARYAQEEMSTVADFVSVHQVAVITLLMLRHAVTERDVKRGVVNVNVKQPD